jgi:hypothetical protein
MSPCSPCRHSDCRAACPLALCPCQGHSKDSAGSTELAPSQWRRFRLGQPQPEPTGSARAPLCLGRGSEFNQVHAPRKCEMDATLSCRLEAEHRDFEIRGHAASGVGRTKVKIPSAPSERKQTSGKTVLFCSGRNLYNGSLGKRLGLRGSVAATRRKSHGLPCVPCVDAWISDFPLDERLRKKKDTL